MQTNAAFLIKRVNVSKCKIDVGSGHSNCEINVNAWGFPDQKVWMQDNVITLWMCASANDITMGVQQYL